MAPQTPKKPRRTADYAEILAHDLRKGVYKSYHHAAAQFSAGGASVSASTVRNRFLGLTKSREEAARNLRKLTPVEENQLVAAIRHCYLSGYPLSLSIIKNMAEIIINKRDPFNNLTGLSSARLGKNWPTAFYKSRPELKAIQAEATNLLRKRHSNIRKIREYFEEFHKEVILEMRFQVTRGTTSEPPLCYLIMQHP